MRTRVWLAVPVLAALVAAPPIARAAHGCEGSIVQQVGEHPTQVDAPYPLGVAMDHCSGYANQSEGYVAAGDWSLKIKRGFFTYSYSSAAGDPPCWLGLIRAGDFITVKVTTGYMFIFHDQGAAKQSCP